jgi:hypothetical protein
MVLNATSNSSSTLALDNSNNNDNNPKNSQVSKNQSETITTPTSDGTSFITARSRNSRPNSSIYSSIDSTFPYLEHNEEEDEEEEIDYQILNGSNKPQNNNTSDKDDDDTVSIKTIKPSKGKSPINSSTTKKTRKINRFNKNKKSLLWKKAGSVFVPSSTPTANTTTDFPPPTNNTTKAIKREPILCMRSVTDCHGSMPSRYKANKEARFDLLTEKWRQVELVLTNTFISTYASSVSLLLVYY